MFIAVAQKKTNAVPQCVQGLRHSHCYCGHRGFCGHHQPRPVLLYVSLTSAWGNNGAATETENITWKDIGYAKSLLISYRIHRLSQFAFEVNGEHGSVQGWEDYWTHAGDAGVVTTTLWCRQLIQQSGGAQLFSIVDHQLVQYRTLDCIVLAQLIPVPSIVLYVFLIKTSLLYR